MDWIDIAWPVMGGACLMLGLVHGWAWLRRPREPVNLVFALACLSVAVISAIERLMMDSRDPVEYGDLLRWAHLAGAVMFVSLVAFVHFQYRSSRASLCVFVCLTRLVALVANFTTGVNINYEVIHALDVVTVVGGVDTAVPVGEVNPWMAFGQASIFALLVYLFDTAYREWRASPRETRWSVVRVCGGIALFVLLVNAWRMAVVFGLIPAPDALVPAFLCVVVVMTHELGADFLRSADLSASLSDTRERLHDFELQAQVAARAGDMGLWGWDLQKRRYWVTELGLRLFGFAPGQPLDVADLERRIHPEDRAAAAAAFRTALEQGGDYRADYRILTWQGSQRHLSVRGQVELTFEGEPKRFYGVVSDVTERVQQEERFELAVEASPTAMLMIRRDGGITLANRQTEIVFGYERAELLRMSVEDLLPERLRARHAGFRADYLQSATSRLMGPGRDLLCLRRDGSEIPVEVALNPVRVGDELFVLASVVDVSERRRLESEAARHRNELAHLSRVALLAELSGSLAHELNQPLTAILSNAQAAIRFLTRKPPDLDEVAASLSNIVESDKRAGEVIRRLRAMLRKEPAEHRATDLNEVVADVLRIIRSDLLNRSTQVELDLAPDLPPVWGDRIQLQQVLLNLITNGSDAMEGLASGRRLVIRTGATPAGGVQVSVVDHGTGIPAESLEAIFQPFVSTKADGMGLGLAVCMSIIESHRGRLWASNNDVAGASVHFSLPPADAPDLPRE